MKKLLFTLCAVLAGFAANAGSLTAAYVPNTGYTIENNEITIEPGQTARVFVSVTNMNGIVEGFQSQMCVRDAAGNAYGLDGNVILKPLTSSNPNVFVALGMSKLVGNGFGQSQPVEEGVQMYRIIATNTTKGAFWIGSEEDALAFFNVPVEELYLDVDEGGMGATASMFQQGNVFRFDIQTSENWNEEYATLDIDEDYDKVSWHGEAAGKLGLPDLKIKNANWQAPLEDLTGTVTFTVDEETGKVTVTYTGDEDVTIMINGVEYTEPIQLEDGVETTLNYEVTAAGYNPLTGSEKLTWNAPTPDQTAAPEITYTAENGTLTVTATGAQGDAIILNGPNNENATGTTTASATVTYDPYVGYTGTWTATAQADGELVSEAASKAISVEAITPTVAVPEISFEETKDGEVVTAVDVVIVNYTSYAITNNDQPVRTTVAHIDANYTEDQVIKVDATNDPIQGHSEFAQTAHGEYTLAKLAKKAVAAPEITTSMDDNNVYVTITWPESDGEHMYNGEYTYPRTDQDQSFNVEAYVAEGATCAESTHATAKIDVPKKVTTPTEQTGQPVFVNSPYTKPNQNAYFYQLANATEEPNAVIYYRVIDPDGNIVGATDENPEGWQVYTPGQEIGTYGANGGGKDGTWRVEAYAQAPGKAPSSVIAQENSVGPTTGIDELIGGKAIANVRYFNMAGQEMQEANGMTIVVTTYTDGTTSAVKVMK